ncbi:MAG TPA: hypothetical protein PLX84_13470 [Acidiphilium sp.]|nr:MAG: hypothetical protein B7Z57_09780 [Acidiphilium sp. 37-60-79]HQT74941.1 hypothetical protein [Acidiphilium sp.]
MAKPFSAMTETEKAENRRRLARGLPANFEEKSALAMTPEEYAAAKAMMSVDAEVTSRRKAEAAYVAVLKGRKE